MLLVDKDGEDDARYQANNGSPYKNVRDNVSAVPGTVNASDKHIKSTAKQTGGDGDEQRLDENQDPQKQLFHYGTPMGIR